MQASELRWNATTGPPWSVVRHVVWRSTSISSQCNVDSPGFSELSSTQNDDMDISLESTSDTCDQTAMLLFSSDEAVNFNPGSILYSPSTSQDESSSYTPFICHDASLSTVSQEASLSNTHQHISIIATPQRPSLLTTHQCTDRSTARQLLSMSSTHQDASTPPPPPPTILDGSTSHHPATGQEFSISHPPSIGQESSTSHPLSTGQESSTSHPSTSHPPSTGLNSSNSHPSVVNQDTLMYVCPWCGFKICGDNIDKGVHCRHMRFDRQMQSLHYFHSYAVRDRVDCSNLADDPPSTTPTARDVISKVLPTDEDDTIIHDEFAILVARILCKHMTFFESSYADVVDWHIEHQFSKEMSQKSDVVSIF